MAKEYARFKAVYYYPQGWILKEEDLIGLCSDDRRHYSCGESVVGTVVGYDEINMWLRIDVSR